MASSVNHREIIKIPKKRFSSENRENNQQGNIDTPSKPFTSFFIEDILNSRSTPVISRHEYDSSPTPPSPFQPIHPKSANRSFRAVRRTVDSCWARRGSLTIPRPRPLSGVAVAAAIFEGKKGDKASLITGDPPDAPLTALEQLASKTFTGLETSILKAAEAAAASGKRDSVHLLHRQTPRKKRKSRTAFTNHQIFELERRFLYQKYLTPADRDELASSLGLTNAQVITWFQNRRAKLKRDIDELKADLNAAPEKKYTKHEREKRKEKQQERQNMRYKLERLRLHSSDMKSRPLLPPPLILSAETRRHIEARDTRDLIDEDDEIDVDGDANSTCDDWKQNEKMESAMHRLSNEKELEVDEGVPVDATDLNKETLKNRSLATQLSESRKADSTSRKADSTSESENDDR